MDISKLIDKETLYKIKELSDYSKNHSSQDFVRILFSINSIELKLEALLSDLEINQKQQVQFIKLILKTVLNDFENGNTK